MWSRLELQAFLERQRAAEAVLLAEAEAAAEFASARASWDAAVDHARGSWARREEVQGGGARSASRFEGSLQG